MSNSPINPETVPNRERFRSSLEHTGASDIYVINPDEYNLLAAISDQDASDLPNGLYVMDETVRDRLNGAGLDYETLSQAVISGARLRNSGDDEERLRLGRENSAHQVFFASLQLQGESIDSQPDYEGNILVAVKPHENGKNPKKPFRELGNLALLQETEMTGIYKPLGLLKRGDIKFLITEFRTGVNSLVDHKWLAAGLNKQEFRKLDETEKQAMHQRDTELIKKVFSLLGSLHAQGIFQGDAASRNIGWSSNGSRPSLNGSIVSTGDIVGVDLTILDLENAQIFQMENGDFGEDYFQGLPNLAANELAQFFSSVPKFARSPLPTPIDKWTRPRVITPEVKEHVLENFVESYIKAFTDHRTRITGSEVDEKIITELTDCTVRSLQEHIRAI